MYSHVVWLSLTVRMTELRSAPNEGLRRLIPFESKKTRPYAQAGLKTSCSDG